MTTPRIAIAGAGFAGLAAARQLARLARTEADIHLFDRHAFTTMIPALPDVAGGRLDPNRIRADIAALTKPEIHVHIETVQKIDLEQKELTTAGSTFAFDFLILATGAAADTRGLRQPPLDAAHTLATLDDANRIRQDFTAFVLARSAPTAVVVGGGYTGLELACNLKSLAARHGKTARVIVVEMKDAILAGLPEKIRSYLEAQARRQGIDLATGVRVTDFDGANVALSNGNRLEDVFFCWSTGTRRALPELHGEHREIPDGRILVDEFLRLPQHPQTFVAGDAAAILVKDVPLRKAVNFAYYSGLAAGRNVLKSLRGQPLRPFRPVDLGWVIPFGQTAAGQALGIDFLKGRLPLAMHYAMCGYRNFNLGHQLYFAGVAMRALTGRL